MGVAADEKGQLPEAIASYRQAVRLNPPINIEASKNLPGGG